jgi:DNA polymerase-4
LFLVPSSLFHVLGTSYLTFQNTCARHDFAVARSILHVDLDAFFVSVEQVRDASLRGKPVVVGGDPDGRGVVATASYEARAFGVHSAMPLRTAKRLAPEAIFVRGDYAEYERVSGRFHAILHDFSPLVESGGLDEAYVDVTGCEPITGTPRDAAVSIRRRVREELGIAASVGIATSKLVAKVASDRAKPDGICEVAAGTEAAFFAPLPLRALPMLGESMEKRLRPLGVSTLGEVAALPAATLHALFGHQGQLIGQRVRGIDPSLVAGERADAKSISREGTFTADMADPVRLRAILRGFSESVAGQLRGQGRRGRTVSIKVRFGDFATVSRSLTLRRPANSDAALYQAAERLLNQVRGQDARAIRLLGVGVSNLVADEHQLSLEPLRDDREEAISAAFDRVRNKYGRRMLQTGRTAFDKATGSEDWRHGKSIGLSAQIDAEK